MQVAVLRGRLSSLLPAMAPSGRRRLAEGRGSGRAGWHPWDTRRTCIDRRAWHLPRTSAMRLAALFPHASASPPGALWPRWIFLRALGLIFFSAFYSFAFQLRG